MSESSQSPSQASSPTPQAGVTAALAPEAPPTNARPARSKKPLIVGGALLGGLLLVGGGLAVWSFYSAAGDASHVVSADASFYSQVNANPTGSQKLNFVQLLERYPELKDDELFKAAQEGDALEALYAQIAGEGDYSWAGDTLALAGGVDGSGELQVAFVLSTTDQAAAEEAMPELIERLEAETGLTGLTHTLLDDGYIGLHVPQAKSLLVTEGEGRLSDDEGFQESFGDKGGNVLAGWIDLEDSTALADAGVAAAGFATGLPAVPTSTDELPELSGDAAFGLEVKSNGVELIMDQYNVLVDGEEVKLEGSPAQVAKLLDGIAYDNAAVNLGIAGLGQTLADNWEALDPEGDITAAYAQGGVNLPEDIPAIMGDAAAFSLDYAGEGDPSYAAKFSGVDEEKVTAFLQASGLSEETALQYFGLTEEANIFTVEDDEVYLQVGEAPTGVGSSQEGYTVGKVNLDRLFGGEGDYGVISFNVTKLSDEAQRSTVSWRVGD